MRNEQYDRGGEKEHQVLVKLLEHEAVLIPMTGHDRVKARVRICGEVAGALQYHKSAVWSRKVAYFDRMRLMRASRSIFVSLTSRSAFTARRFPELSPLSFVSLLTM